MKDVYGMVILIALVLLMAPAGSRVSYGQDQTKEEETSFVKGIATLT